MGFDEDHGLNRLKVEGRAGHPLGKNPGDVWRLPTAAYRGAHFATFPQALVERPLLATCPQRVCAACGTPWQREAVDRSQAVPVLGQLRPACTCCAETTPGIVLDPFFGSGTIGVVAERFGRDWLGVELNAKYAALARERINAARKQAA
jgi:DNA modification methylase